MSNTLPKIKNSSLINKVLPLYKIIKNYYNKRELIEKEQNLSNYDFYKKYIVPLYNKINDIKFEQGNFKIIRRNKRNISFSLYGINLYINKYGVLFYKCKDDWKLFPELDLFTCYKKELESIVTYPQYASFFNLDFRQYLLNKLAIEKALSNKDSEYVYVFK